MKAMKLVIVLLLLCLAGVGNVMADRGHRPHYRSHFSVVIGPYWGPWYYPPPPFYYTPYYPPVVIERPAPPVYIEQQPAAVPAAPAPDNYWYYCAAAQGYYPYVKDCPGGWQKGLPQPPVQR